MNNLLFVEAELIDLDSHVATPVTDPALARFEHPSFKTKVLIETPLTARSKNAQGMNQLYARAALRDSLLRGEAPIANDMLYSQQFVLDNNDPVERELGIEASAAWLPLVDRVVVYVDRGINERMLESLRRAEDLGVIVEKRSIEDWGRV